MQFHTRSPRVLRASFAYHYFLRKLAAHLHRMISTTMCRNSQSISRVFLWIDSLDWIGLDWIGFSGCRQQTHIIGFGRWDFFPDWQSFASHLHTILALEMLRLARGSRVAAQWRIKAVAVDFASSFAYFSWSSSSS